jgi:RNA polymerase subunit RPABC4/transcription elongation factor Spt4
MAIISCKNCSAQISDKAKKCPKCETPQTLNYNEKIKCLECNTELEKNSRICNKCGASQGNNVLNKEDNTIITESNNLKTIKVIHKQNKKNLFFKIGVGLILIVAVSFLFFKNIGPSKEELEAAEKAKADSIALADKLATEKTKQDSIRSIQIADSLAFVENQTMSSNTFKNTNSNSFDNSSSYIKGEENRNSNEQENQITIPVVIDSRADGSKSGIFNARTTVKASIQNQGGPGSVLVTFSVYQGGNVYDRSKLIYLNTYEIQNIEMVFEEVNYIDGEITYDVNAVAQ